MEQTYPITDTTLVIELGVHALHRANTTESSPVIFEDRTAGLRVMADLVGEASRPVGPFVAMIVEGAVEVAGIGRVSSGEALAASAGTAVIPVEPGARWVTIACRDIAGPAKGVALRHSEHPDLPDCSPPSREVLLTEPPIQKDLTLYSDSARSFGAGLWSSTCFKRRTIPFPKFEVIHVLSGHLEVVYEEGHSDLFKPGDTALIVKGTRFEWRTEGLEKIWCSFAPET